MADSKPPIVFYSWQSDLPNRTNRGLIHDALERACKDLTAECEEAERGPVVDADTQGVSGSPDIAATILAKIDNADVVVADVSIIGTAQVSDSGDPPKTRPVPNPNVMLELGYAKKALGADRVIMVCNAAFGEVEALPFDIRGKTVLRYKYDGGAEPAETRKALRGRLKAAVGAAISVARPAGREAEAERELGERRQLALDRWRSDRASTIEYRPPVPLDLGAIVVVRLLSARSLDGSIQIDLTSADRILDRGELCPAGAAAWSWAHGEDWLASDASGPDQVPVQGYTQLFSNGIIEYVSLLPSCGEAPELDGLADLAIKALGRISPGPRKLGLGAPYFVSLDLLRIGGAQVRRSSFLSPFGKARAIQQDSLHPPFQLVPDEDVLEHPEAILKPALDRIWRAANFPACPNYGEDGKIRHW